MKVTKNSTIINKLQKVLDKKYGEFGRIIIREDEKGIIEVIFEENDYLYIALNCYNVTMFDEVDEVIAKILYPYNLYMELENNCVGKIWSI